MEVVVGMVMRLSVFVSYICEHSSFTYVHCSFVSLM